MPPSKKQMADLIARTPPCLREPDDGAGADPGPKGALTLWAAARGFNPPSMVRHTLRVPDDDEFHGTVFAGNAAAVALITQLHVESELERTKQIESSRAGKPAAKTRSPGEEIEHLVHLRRLSSSDAGSRPRLNLTTLAKQAYDDVEEHRTRGELKHSQLVDHVRLHEAFKQHLAVPIVSSGYMLQRQRAPLVAEKTVILHNLSGMGIPLLRAIAMIGDLRNGAVPVDVNHPRIDRIYDRHSENLRALHKELQNATGRFEVGGPNLPVEPSGKKRHKRREERAAPNKRTKRKQAANRG
jgi:hypothetical protein